MKRVIALVDCNNFFVSCERLLKPELIGKPVCVLSNNDGCVVSRSNEAKKMGVEMGAPYFIAKNQFKKVIFLSGNLPYYCEISKRVMDKLQDFTPDIEIYSIDEAFLDLTGLRKTFNCSYEEITERIVKDIKEEIGIDVSVGLSYSKVLAKLANDKAKNLQKTLPDKKTYKIGYRQIKEELKGTLISEIWGIGRNTQALLNKYLIQTAYDFISQDDIWIKKKMGKIGLDMKQELLGNSISPVIAGDIAPKSISRSESFKEFQTDKNYIQEQLNSHIHKVCKKLREENQMTSCISVMLRTKDFQVENIKLNLAYPINIEFDLIEKSKEMLNQIFKKGVIYRSVGFCAYKLTSAETQQISIFDSNQTLKKQELLKSCDKLEERFGRGIIKLGILNKK
ncbi:MAG: Y-family DNA polymerase [Candidatus Gastranaerophilales bacterium]|nr:Y-family DNA polymerase [Candidatus Gastranaerophilales bacterium]